MAAPAAGAGDRCRAQRPNPAACDRNPASTRRRNTAGKALSAEPFRSNVLQASLAHVLRGEHGGQQPCGVARQRRLRVGAVIGGNGSGDVVSATQVGGHSSGVPRLCRGRAGQARARASPRQEIGSCETGLSWGMLLIVEISSSSPASAGCSWPALPAGFGISRVLGSAAPRSARRNRHRVSLRACQTESRRSKGQLQRARQRSRCKEVIFAGASTRQRG